MSSEPTLLLAMCEAVDMPEHIEQAAVKHIKLGYQTPTLGIDAAMLISAYQCALYKVKTAL